MGAISGYSFSVSNGQDGKPLHLVVQHNGKDLGEQFEIAVEHTHSELIVDNKYVGFPLKIKDATGNETWVKVNKLDLIKKFHLTKPELKQLETSDQLESCMIDHLTKLLLADQDLKSAVQMLPENLDDIPEEFLNTSIFQAEKPNSKKSLIKKIFGKIPKRIASAFHSLSTSHVFMRYGKQLKDKEYLLQIEKGKSFEEQEKEIYQNTTNPSQISQKLNALNKEKKRFNDIHRRKEFMKTAKEDLKILGGEKIELITPDHVKLDAMYLDTNQFKKMLRAADGSLITYNIKLENDEQKKFQAIALPKSEYGSKKEDILSALNRLNKNIHGNSLPNFIWQTVETEDKILLMRNEEIEQNKSIIKWDFGKNSFSLAPPLNAQVKKIEEKIPEGKAAGTVILSSGAFGLYENTVRSNALFFLFKNMNVVLFNFRGYGESEGVPSKKGLKIDMESAYQLALKKSGQKPKKILFKALCMSGGPAAYVAGQHPETNIFLDQSYSGFRKLAKQNIRSEFDKYFSTGTLKFTGNFGKFLATCISGIVNLFIHYTIPDYNTAKYLEKNKGIKGLLYATDDEIISHDHVEANLKAITKAREIQNTLIFPIPGKHDQEIVRIESSLFSHFSKLEQKKIQDLINLKMKLEKDLKQKINASKTQELMELEQSDIKKLEKNIMLLTSNLIDLLPVGVTLENLKKYEMIGQKQLNLFLSKAGLSDDLIKPSSKLVM